MDIPQIDINDLQTNDIPRIIWVKVQEAAALEWDRNPKSHDMGALIQSIEKYGFQELPKYDATLGGIKSGNGRTLALAEMEKANYKLPRGLAAIEEGDRAVWVMPVLIGTDAESMTLAKAYAIDANNLTMAGGDLTAYDMMRVWSSAPYMEILRELYQEGELPVSVDGDDLDSLTAILNMQGGDYGGEIEIDPDQISKSKDFVFRVRVKDMDLFKEIITAVKGLVKDNGWDAEISI